MTNKPDRANDFDLAAPQAPAATPARRKAKPAASKSAGSGEETQIVSYRHPDRRKNNPEVGMVTPLTDPDDHKNRWAYDPHIDPALAFDPSRAQIEALIDDALASDDPATLRAALEELKRRQSPYLNWAGKAERTSFDVDTVSLHVHERIDPASILSAVRKQMQGERKAGAKTVSPAIQPGLFDAPFENLPLRDAIDFYRHERGWANRLVAGDSLLVMKPAAEGKHGWARADDLHRPALRHQIRLQLPALRRQARRQGQSRRRPDAGAGNDQGLP